jgi:hypothetical protein
MRIMKMHSSTQDSTKSMMRKETIIFSFLIFSLFRKELSSTEQMETKQSMNNKYQVGRYNLVLFK